MLTGFLSAFDAAITAFIHYSCVGLCWSVPINMAVSYLHCKFRHVQLEQTPNRPKKEMVRWCGNHNFQAGCGVCSVFSWLVSRFCDLHHRSLSKPYLRPAKACPPEIKGFCFSSHHISVFSCWCGGGVIAIALPPPKLLFLLYYRHWTLHRFDSNPLAMGVHSIKPVAYCRRRNP